MGEYADLILEGHICQHCGQSLQNADSYPQSCCSCRAAENIERAAAAHATAKKGPCPKCGKRVKLIGMADHQRDAHGVDRDTS